jgi:hypothetical protein
VDLEYCKRVAYENIDNARSTPVVLAWLESLVVDDGEGEDKGESEGEDEGEGEDEDE